MGGPFGMDPRKRPRERFPETVYWLPWLAIILVSLYVHYYRRYAWVLLAATIALALVMRSLVVVVAWCVLTVAYLVGLGAYELAVRVIEGPRRTRQRGRHPPRR